MGQTTPLLPIPEGIFSLPRLIHGFLDPHELALKRYLDHFSRLCKVRPCDQHRHTDHVISVAIGRITHCLREMRPNNNNNNNNAPLLCIISASLHGRPRKTWF